MKTRHMLLISPLILIVCCSEGTGGRSPISRPIGQLRNIYLKPGQVWSGSFDPDGRGTGGSFSMLVSEVDQQGNFGGYMKAGLIYNGNGRISGTSSGSEIRFTLQHAANPSTYEQYGGSYSDNIRGRYKTKRFQGAYSLALSSISEKQFLISYNNIISEEQSEIKRASQSRTPSNVVYRNAPSYNSPQQQSFNDWDAQRRQEQLMERQTEAMEKMQRDASWNNFERNQHATLSY